MPTVTTLPTLAELGDDLLVASPRQRVLALARPYAGVAVFVAVAALRWWWITPLVVFGIFVAVVTATHDVVHRTLGLGPRATDVWLFLLGLVLLESGHAYSSTPGVTVHSRAPPVIARNGAAASASSQARTPGRPALRRYAQNHSRTRNTGP